MSDKTVCVTIYFNPTNPDNPDYESEARFQYYDFDIIPHVGENFSVYSSRDEDGNYHPKGEVHEVFSGVVEKVSYTYEQQGKVSASFSETLFIEINLRGVR